MRKININIEIPCMNKTLDNIKEEHINFIKPYKVNEKLVYELIDKINSVELKQIPSIAVSINRVVLFNILNIAFSNNLIKNMDNFVEVVKIKSKVVNLKILNLLFLELFDNYIFIDLYKDFPNKLTEEFIFKDFILNDPVKKFVEYIKNHSNNLDFRQIYKEFDINYNTKFYKKTFIKAVISLNKIQLLNLRTSTYNEFLELASLIEKSNFFNNYIQNVDYLSEIIVEPIIKEMGDECLLDVKKLRSNQFWINITKENFERVRLWYLSKKIEYTFGNDERSIFWKKYVGHFKVFYHKKESNQVFMFINQHVIVEFLDIGNATYIYKLTDFNERFLNKMNSTVNYNNNAFKDKFIAYKKLDHRNGWQHKFDTNLRYIIN